MQGCTRWARSALAWTALVVAGCGGSNDESTGAVTSGGSGGASPHPAGTGGNGGSGGFADATGTGGALATTTTGTGTGGAGGAGGASDCTGTFGAGFADLPDGGTGPITCDGPGARFATSVVTACFGPGQNGGQDKLPGIVLGPPEGGGCCTGSLDVCSLGNGGSIVLAFAGDGIVDGPGVDFLVFENPFEIGGNPSNVYAELATVGVSADGVSWTDFPCTATKPPYGTCAGWNPVYANPKTNSISPLDPAVAGGDPFDLAMIGVPFARFVRITDRPDLPTVFDLDAVAVVHPACP